MHNMIKKIIQYPRLTWKYPREPMDTTYFTGKPKIIAAKCNFCGQCLPRCPSRAMVMDQGKQEIGINLDECIFCALCEEICPTGAVFISKEYELATKDRNSLRQAPITPEKRIPPYPEYEIIEAEMREKILKVFGRSLHIREVDAGSCNACDYEINALNNPMLDLERLGLHFVASPRHGDMLLVTGTATRNMELALVKTYNATPDPKLVVAIGACACSGGIFRDSYATRNGIDTILPVDVYVPGCPPRPQAILHGIIKAINRIS